MRREMWDRGMCAPCFKKKLSYLSNLPSQANRKSGHSTTWCDRKWGSPSGIITSCTSMAITMTHLCPAARNVCFVKLFYVCAFMGAHTATFGTVFKVHCGSRTLKQIWSLRRASWPVSPPASEERGRRPYDSLCSADSSLMHFFYLHQLLRGTLTKQWRALLQL